MSYKSGTILPEMLNNKAVLKLKFNDGIATTECFCHESKENKTYMENNDFR